MFKATIQSKAEAGLFASGSDWYTNAEKNGHFEKRPIEDAEPNQLQKSQRQDGSLGPKEMHLKNYLIQNEFIYVIPSKGKTYDIEFDDEDTMTLSEGDLPGLDNVSGPYKVTGPKSFWFKLEKYAFKFNDSLSEAVLTSDPTIKIIAVGK